MLILELLSSTATIFIVVITSVVATVNSNLELTVPPGFLHFPAARARTSAVVMALPPIPQSPLRTSSITTNVTEEVRSGDWGIGGKAMTTADVRALAAGK